MLNNNQEIIKTKAKLDTAFSDAFFAEGIYTPKLCHLNNIQLFNYFKREVPNINKSDFKVLLIAPNPWFKTKGVLNVQKTLVRYARMKYQPQYTNRNLSFDYHVVVEFKGQIYDLSYTNNPTPVSKTEYYENNFYDIVELAGSRNHNLPKEELVVVPVPGELYFSKTPDQLDQASELFGMIEGIRKQWLRKYIEEN